MERGASPRTKTPPEGDSEPRRAAASKLMLGKREGR